MKFYQEVAMIPNYICRKLQDDIWRRMKGKKIILLRKKLNFISDLDHLLVNNLTTYVNFIVVIDEIDHSRVDFIFCFYSLMCYFIEKK